MTIVEDRVPTHYTIKDPPGRIDAGMSAPVERVFRRIGEGSAG